jgi:hypothetical protein
MTKYMHHIREKATSAVKIRFLEKNGCTYLCRNINSFIFPLVNLVSRNLGESEERAPRGDQRIRETVTRRTSDIPLASPAD